MAGVTRLGTFDCSGAAPCRNITISDVSVKRSGTGVKYKGIVVLL